jgi:hypothetical protein
MSALSSGVTTVHSLPQYPSAAHGYGSTDKQLDMPAEETSPHSATLELALENDLQAAEVVKMSRLLKLEGDVRAALKRRRTVYKGEHALLEHAFQHVDDGSGELDASGLVQVPQLHHALPV